MLLLTLNLQNYFNLKIKILFKIWTNIHIMLIISNENVHNLINIGNCCTYLSIEKY